MASKGPHEHSFIAGVGSVALDEVKDAGGELRLAYDFGEKIRADRCGLAWLDDHATARWNRWRQLAGLRCINFSHAYGKPPSIETGLKLLLRALNLGITHFDTAALSGFGEKEELLGETLSPFRKRIFTAGRKK